MFCTWWKAFFGAALRRSLRDQPVSWNDAFHGYITGRRREGAMITQRVVSWRLRQEGIQHLTDFEECLRVHETKLQCGGAGGADQRGGSADVLRKDPQLHGAS